MPQIDIKEYYATLTPAEKTLWRVDNAGVGKSPPEPANPSRDDHLAALQDEVCDLRDRLEQMERKEEDRDNEAARQAVFGDVD